MATTITQIAVRTLAALLRAVVAAVKAIIATDLALILIITATIRRMHAVIRNVRRKKIIVSFFRLDLRLWTALPQSYRAC